MNDKFDLAFSDLGLSPSGGEGDFYSFVLQREDRSEIIVSLFKDTEQLALRMSVHTSNKIPHTISREFFECFAQAALEPLRGGMGVGMSPGCEHLCVYHILPLAGYGQGHSLMVLENLVEHAENWDERLGSGLHAAMRYTA